MLSVVLMACASESGKEQKKPDTEKPKQEEKINVPAFAGDSAYHYVARQVAFGPRVPNTAAHEACGDWLVQQMSDWADKVIQQKAQVEAFNGDLLDMRNIIAVFNPEAKKRIMLSAHWDTRPFADQDPNPGKRDQPIAGANDGASGVGVLMEIARQLKKQPVEMGVDIVFWDVEDYGQPNNDTENPYMSDSYCLGSQYWSRNKHQANYTAKYGILLDMVGAENATFRLEGHSMQFAPTFTRKVWNKAIELGHGQYFILEETRPVIDDHYYLTRIGKIPTIDIIDLKPRTRNQFGSFWHTHDDDMEIISEKTLDAVGETLMHVVYLEDKNRF